MLSKSISIDWWHQKGGGTIISVTPWFPRLTNRPITQPPGVWGPPYNPLTPRLIWCHDGWWHHQLGTFLPKWLVITYASAEGSVSSVSGKIIFYQVINLKNPNSLFLEFLNKCTWLSSLTFFFQNGENFQVFWVIVTSVLMILECPYLFLVAPKGIYWTPYQALGGLQY